MITRRLFSGTLIFMVATGMLWGVAHASASPPGAEEFFGDASEDTFEIRGVRDVNPDDSGDAAPDGDGNESGTPEDTNSDGGLSPVRDPAAADEQTELDVNAYCANEVGAALEDCREVLSRLCYNQGQNVGSVEDDQGNAGLRCVTTGGIIGDDDEEDDVVDLLAQLPGAVEEEFSTLQIDGGSVSFEESLLGFGYLNRHTHMFADVEEQIVETELLGFDVEIRAIPESFQWDYGDGNQRTTYQSGEPLPEYWAGEPVDKTDAETPTSHVYTETGVFDVTLTTTFSGQYRVDGGEWVVIPGASDVASSPGEADIWRQSSRNVSGPCRSQEEWGCNGPVELDPGDRPPKIFQDQYDEHGNWIGEHP